MKKVQRELSRALPGWAIEGGSRHLKLRHPGGAVVTAAHSPKDVDATVRCTVRAATRALHNNPMR